MPRGRAKKTIVVAGGGYAGIGCAKNLEREFGDDPDVEIVIISQDNFLLFTSMLPQVASGMVGTRHIIIPVRAACKKATFHEGRVKSIDPYGKRVDVWGTAYRRSTSIRYDYLVLALGSKTNFFGMGDVERNAYTMKTLNDAVVLRNRAIDMLEQAANEENPVLRRALLNFVVVGAGFAGIETAGEIMDLLLDARVHYPDIRKEDVRVTVLEATSGILIGFDQKLAEFAKDKLKERGIEIRLNTAVTSFDGDVVALKDTGGKGGGEESDIIMTKTLIWTAGVTPVNTIKRSLFKTDHGKIVVDGHLEAEGFPGVFAIGDCALVMDDRAGRPFAPTAQIAEAQAKTAAKNLKAAIRGTARERFAYQSKGQMAIIGKRSGIASIMGVNISGFWAWLLWRLIYLKKMPTVEKKVRVMFDWTMDLLFDRDISRLKMMRREGGQEYRELDEVDDVW